MRGKVKRYYEDKKYGFIKGDDGSDYFVHFSEINIDGYKKLTDGQTVEFETARGEKGGVARSVNIVKRNPMIEHDTEDKQYWCRKGEKIEEAFVREIVPQIKRNIIVHPKKKTNKIHIDLCDLETGLVGDLKTQNTPFFSAMKRGGDPQYTVTFNRKDYKHYKELYPEATIFWWVNWTQLTWNGFSVEPMYGVWEVPFSELRTCIEKGEVQLHQYIHRVGDPDNATSSYLFDVRNFNRLL